MKINSKTTIGKIINYNKAALDAIVGISHKFEKLRNPVLRKLIAGRTTIEMASKLGNCTEDDFYRVLIPLGFEIEKLEMKNIEKNAQNNVPEFVNSISKDKIIDFDVRAILASGADPLKQIIEKTKMVKKGEVLKIINTFEPLPLITLLGKKGFEVYSDVQNENYSETWFYKKTDNLIDNTNIETHSSDDWDRVLKLFEGNLINLDVRKLEMPMPMITILETLETLEPEKALYVFHKKLPIFLIPELKEKGYDFRTKQISEHELHLLIFKK